MSSCLGLNSRFTCECKEVESVRHVALFLQWTLISYFRAENNLKVCLHVLRNMWQDNARHVLSSAGLIKAISGTPPLYLDPIPSLEYGNSTFTIFSNALLCDSTNRDRRHDPGIPRR